MVKVEVTADLPLPANIYFVERDTGAFRGLMAKARPHAAALLLLEGGGKKAFMGEALFSYGTSVWRIAVVKASAQILTTLYASKQMLNLGGPMRFEDHWTEDDSVEVCPNKSIPPFAYKTHGVETVPVQTRQSMINPIMPLVRISVMGRPCPSLVRFPHATSHAVL